MSPNDNRRPGRHSGHGGKNYVSTNNANVIQLPRYFQRETTADPAVAFKALTRTLVMAQHRAGTLDPGIVEYALAAVFK
jgi:hypothetical protein